MEALIDDTRLALRSLRRRARSSLLIVATLAVGIACTTAMFSVVRAVLLQPLPWPESDRLATIWNRPPGSADRLILSLREIRDLQEMAEGFEVGSYSTDDETLSIHDRDVTLQVTWVTRETLSFLGAKPILGRSFHDEEFLFRGPGTAILSHAAWHRYFGGDAEALGQTIDVGGRSHEVIGIMQPGISLPQELKNRQRTDLWIGTTLGWANEWPRETRMFPALVRLDQGTSLEAARAELDRAMNEMARQHPSVYPPGWKAELSPIDAEILGPVRSPILALFGAVFFVLLIACANVAHLLLAQIDGRRGEIALRCALGARHLRIARQLLIESLLLALAGGVFGLVAAFGTIELLLAIQPGDLPRIETVSVDPTVLLFALGVALLTPLVFGLVPILGAAGGDLQPALRRQRAAAVAGLRPSLGRRTLVVAEIALATVLLAGAVLLVGTLRNLARADLGFESQGLTVASVAAPRDARDNASKVVFWDALRTHVGSQSAIDVASTTMSLPFRSGVLSRGLEIEGMSAAQLELPRVTIERAAPRVAEAMGYPLIQGRDFAEEDRRGAVPVALINETLAEYLEDRPVGQRVRIPQQETPWLTVVGVVADAVHEGIDEPIAPRIILPYTQFDDIGMRVTSFNWLALRTQEGAGPTLETLRTWVREVDPDAAILYRFDMEDDVVAEAMARHRFAASVLSLFAGLALVLAVVGIYSLLAYLIHRGRHEIAVRMAIGAKRRDIHRQVSRLGLTLGLAGLAVGIPAALALTRLVETLLYEVEPTEPRAFAVAAAILLAASLTASALPADRATRVEPMEVLRSE
ncbi:MAG: ADOP family duplicated permease [Thermoanaerobaculia bacterium]|nr:ADOP family duplicated permease [Thermoanaerobaculia bacterium]